MNQLHPVIEALRPFLNAWGVARQQAAKLANEALKRIERSAAA